MRLAIDMTDRTLLHEAGGERRVLELYSREAFELVSLVWLKLGWNLKYSYTFTWMGRPVIQIPEDMIRIQEVIYRVKPDVIVETGIAHGGSLIYYASLCKLLGRGRIIGVDIEIRAHNRTAIEAHELYPYLTLIEGDSTDAGIVARVKSLVEPGESVLVVLDSDHARRHVLAELRAYHELVTPGSYIVVADGIMKDLVDVPRGAAAWEHDNPRAAAADFLEEHPEFVVEQPRWSFNASELTANVTYWPGAWLRRR